MRCHLSPSCGKNTMLHSLYAIVCCFQKTDAVKKGFFKKDVLVVMSNL